ncbi:MAG: multiheme c-type cytochrome [Pseudomonadota bacterium]|nr:multiheme c-type cytochrome [Pseudomonadota bacterium]
MGCDAINIGAYDLSLGVDYLRKKEKSAKFPFLSGNILDRHDKHIFTPSIIKTVNGVKVGIFGLCDDKLKLAKIPGGNKIKVVNPLTKAEEISARLKKEGADYIVLLTNLNIRYCRRIGQRGMPIDLIIGSSKKNRISLPILVQETYIAHVERGGKSVGRLDVSFLGSAGVEALPAAVRFKGKTVGDNLFLLNHFFPLKIAMPDQPEIGSMVKKVETKLSRLQQVKATKSMSIGNSRKPTTRPGDSYVFAKTCAQCHPERYQLWLKTPHARAYKSLVEQGKHFDEECIACHVLGFAQPGGFTDIRQVGNYANVQCETCHGPGRLHVAAKGEEKMIKDLAGGEMCLSCHIEERSPEFDLETYFKKTCGAVGK